MMKIQKEQLRVIQIAIADDFAVTSKLASIKDYWEKL